jgi:hypothetical protein
MQFHLIQMHKSAMYAVLIDNNKRIFIIHIKQ